LAVDRHAIAVIDVSWCFYYDDNDDGYYYVLLLLLLLSQSVQYYANKHRSIQECKFYHKRMQSRASCMMRDQSSNRHQATMSVAWHISDTHGYDHKEVYNSTAKYNKHYTHHAVVVMMVIRCSNASKQASKQASKGLSGCQVRGSKIGWYCSIRNCTTPQVSCVIKRSGSASRALSNVGPNTMPVRVEQSHRVSMRAE
jgi:hypothetical protein